MTVYQRYQTGTSSLGINDHVWTMNIQPILWRHTTNFTFALPIRPYYALMQSVSPPLRPVLKALAYGRLNLSYIILSAKKVMFSSAFIRLFVCLFVC